MVNGFEWSTTSQREGSKNIARHGENVEFVEGDLADPSVAAEAVRGIEIVFHEAAVASVPRSIEAPLETHEACTTATVVLLDACRKASVRRVVYAASSSAYGNAEVMPLVETCLPNPVSPYAAAKLAGEMYLEAFAGSYPLETVRLRYFNVFGPKQDPNGPYSAVIPLFVAALLSGRQPIIFGDGTQSRDFVYVDNVVSANLKAAAAPKASGRVYNVAGGSSLSVNDLLNCICQIMEKRFEPRYAAARIGDIMHSWADISAARRDLGFEIEVEVREGLSRTVKYYSELYRAER